MDGPWTRFAAPSPAAGPWSRFVSNVPPQVDTATPSLGDILVQQIGAGTGPAPLAPAQRAAEPAPLGMPVADAGLGAPVPLPAPPVDPMLQAIAMSTPAPGADMTPAPTGPGPDIAGLLATVLDPYGTTREFGKGLVSGGASSVSAGARALGFPETAQSATDFSNRPDLAAAVPSFRNVDGPQDAAKYAAGLVGQSAPEMGTVLAAGTVGAAGGPVGSFGAMMATSSLFNTGRNVQRQEAENPGEDVKWGRAIGTGIAQSGLDTLVPGHVIGAFGTRLLGSLAEKGILKAGAAIGADVAVEGVTEALQQVGEIGQANPDLLRIMVDPKTPEEVKRSDALIGEVIDSLVGGGVAGGAFGTFGHIVQSGEHEPTSDQPDANRIDVVPQASAGVTEPQTVAVIPPGPAPAQIAPLAPAVVPQQPASLAPAPTAEPPLAPQEPIHAPTETPPPASPVALPREAAALPLQPAVPQAPQAVAEPPVPQSKPFTYLARQAGIQIDPDGPAGKELRANGITVKTNPGLFRRGGMSDVDNIVAAEHPELHQILGDDGTGNYLPRNGIIDALVSEASGRPVRGAEQQHIAAIRAEWENMQGQAAQAYVNDPVPLDLPEPTIPHPSEDWAPEGDRRQSVEHHVSQAVQTLGVTLTPDEHAAIIDTLDRNGGSIEQAIEQQIIRSVLNEDAGRPIEAQQGIPGFEEPGASGGVARQGNRNPEPTGRITGSEGQHAPGAQEPGRAGQGPAETRPLHLTTEPGAEGKPQYLIPGTEQRQTGEAQRQKAEVAARQQQSKIRKTGQQRVEGDENSLFGEKPVDLFAAPAVDTGDTAAQNAGVLPSGGPPQAAEPYLPKVSAAAPPPSSGTELETTGRKPKGRMSPGFLDFSYTNKASVYDAAFKDAGINPDDARAMPIEKQIATVAGVLTRRYGVKVELPNIKVQKRNLVGRKVTVERQSITTREGLDQLLDAYRNMQMMASILGVPERALGLELDGQPITLSLVSTSRLKGALGMFSWGEKGRKITLAGRSNSFAHEWGHALDHFLTKQVARDGLNGLLSREVDAKGIRPAATPRADIREAFAHVVASLFTDQAKMAGLMLELQAKSAEVDAEGKPTLDAARATATLEGIKAGRRPPAAYLSRYFETSAEYDALSGAGKYFQDPAEMLARAFEAWIGRSARVVSDLPQGFLSKGWGYDAEGDTRLEMTFPKEADAQGFAIAITELTNALGRMEVFGPDAPAAAPDDASIYSVNGLLKSVPQSGLIESQKRALRASVASFQRTFTKAETLKAARDAKFTLDGAFKTMLNSTTATLHSIAARQTTAEAKQVFTTIADHLGRDPGSGRLLKPVYEEVVHEKIRRRTIQLNHALAKAIGKDQISEKDNADLRALLTGQKVPTATPQIKALASDMRAILNDIWYDLTSPKEGGLTLGYADGYLPRITDRQAVEENPKGFTKDASSVYALMFDREVIQNDDEEAQNADIKTVINSLRAARMPTETGESEPVSRLSPDDEVLISTWRAARKKLRDLMKRAEKDPLNTKLGPQIAAAQDAHDNAKADMLDMLQERFALASADHWRVAMRVGNQNDFDTMGPTASFLKGRVLPPETDQMMEKYLVSDPVELVSGYIHASARRAEYAKRFGPKGEKLENMLAAAENAGANATDIGLARMGVNSATGRFQHPNSFMQSLAGVTFVVGTLRLLGRATFASLSEPLTAGLRSGYVRDSGKAMAANVRVLTGKKYRRELFELAGTMGLITSSLNSGIMASRLSSDTAVTGGWLHDLVGKFYYKTMLTPLTNFQHVAMLPVAHAIILRHLRATEGGNKWLWIKDQSGFSHRELNELGIPKEDRADLLDWLEGFQGLPTSEDLLSADGNFYGRPAELWAGATTRLIHETIQEPLKSDRPMMANHPMYAALYGIMSFMQAFQRNILIRNFRRGVGAKETAVGKVWQSVKNPILAVPAVGMMLLGQFLTTMMREALFNWSTWQQHEDDDDLWKWLLWRAFSRTGLTGVFDPLVQAVTSVKYERDLTALLVGPMLSSILQDVQKVIGGMPGQGRNSGNTNSAEHNAAAAAWNLSAMPAMVAAASAFLPLGVAAPLIWWGSSPQMAQTAADMMVGPKGTNYHKDRADHVPWYETGTLTPAQQKRADKLAAQGD